MELEKPDFEFRPPPPDVRPTLPQPLPVRLVAVADVRLPCPPDTSLREALDGFYVGLVGMRRLPSDDQTLLYQADNFSLVLRICDRPVEHDRLSPTMLELDDRTRVLQQLLEREIPFEWMRGLTPGNDYLLLKDPAGNWLGLQERHIVG